MPIPIDQRAQTYGLPECLWIPIAVTDEAAVEKYVGRTEVISSRTQNKAFIVTYHGAIAPPNEDLGIWKVHGAEILQASRQFWAHVNYTGYRKAYERNMPESDIEDCVIDHIMNRRFSRLLGYKYVRLFPISRGANTSSGGGPEKESVKAQQGAYGPPHRDKAEVCYADPSDILKMLNLKTGHFPLPGVAEALKLMYPAKAGTAKGNPALERSRPGRAVNVRIVRSDDEDKP